MTTWSGEAASVYNSVRHGADGGPLLDMPLEQILIRMCEGKDVLDGGCGTGRFMSDALKFGARSVRGIDNNCKMVEIATASLRGESGYERAGFAVSLGDVCDLSELEANMFDLYLSINVGCNLGADGLPRMFLEAYRLLRSGGKMVLTLPDSLDMLFVRDRENMETIRREINRQLETSNDPYSIASMGSVFRASMISDEGQYRLVRRFETVPDGTPIFRKLAGLGDNPGLVVPNNYHSLMFYRRGWTEAGFSVEKEISCKFENEEARNSWNIRVPPSDRIGPLAVANSPFRIVILTKGEES